jgi:anaerobic dimethyl sulfoxide reductase subunit B (iron-sulfur subunit)
MDKQLGFYFNARRCVQCFACEVACKLANDVELGPRWRRVLNRWEDRLPGAADWNLAVSCMHCAEPACRDVCPTNAITKRAEDGIVVVNTVDCIGCGECAIACPYGAPQFGKDGKMQKCNLCLVRLQQGKEPACVSTCPGEALDFGTLEELAKRALADSGAQLTGPTQPSFFASSADSGKTSQTYVEQFLFRT